MATKGSKGLATVCFAASSGGHLEQLLVLEPLMEKHDSFIVTEQTGYDTPLPVRHYRLSQVNRRQASFVFKMFVNVFVSLGILLRERPRIVVCTGVLATVPLCLIGKLFGAKLVYIESFAKTDSPTASGKLLHRYADRFYVQWESMLGVYPDARYMGGIY